MAFEDSLFKTIVVGTDLAACSEPALEAAASLAKASQQSRLFIVHAYEFPLYGYPGFDAMGPDLISAVEQSAREQLDACVARFEERGVRARGVLGVGLASELILMAADEAKADLIVVGTHGRTGLKRAVLGSVAEEVMRHAHAPVLTVRHQVT